MIPTMIVPGLVLGLVPHQWRYRATAVGALAVLMSVAFGLAVGDLVTGTLLALVNATVGFLLGSGIQWLGRAVIGKFDAQARPQSRCH